VTKAALGGRAKHWAVMGVKSEQASKVEMRAPTRRIIGEGRVEGEGIDMRTLSARRGSGNGTMEIGDARNRRRPVRVGGSVPKRHR
jgi:hypothetical protein